ncbi:purine/pyrimidine permease [Rathayibacter sp. ZW T2_19]|uniref:Purine/pyrimidine permease n=1 Tax=Rathayibacter rubneri TaxID=2950106 RepID=A0A9X2IV79_9MICO|nr:solute carrier family 23 protein [Rathayibacter rubneri]MCM6763364.1 purine/pyrimidine permease [Rathayibacter rubneri]
MTAPSSTAPSSTLLTVGFDEKLPPGRTALFATQHLLALTGIWVFPSIIGGALELSAEQVALMIQACFLLTGLVTVLQSSRVLRLPIVQGPTAAFMVAIISSGATFGLGTTFGSMVVAGLIFMALTIPLKRFGLFGRVSAFVSSPIVLGTLFVIIGAQLAGIGAGGWFGTEGTPSFGGLSLAVSIATALIVLLCLLLGRGVVKRGAIFWGIVGGSVVALLVGQWAVPDMLGVPLVGTPHLLPYGFGVEASVVVLMLVAYLQAGTESMGMYTMIASWGGQKVDTQRVNRGLFSEFGGTVVGALFGGIGTTSYPENAGIVRVSRVGSRYVTLTAGVIAVVLAFLPPVSLFLAGVSGPVLSAASTILFGIIAISGVQMLASVKWDDLNLAVGATAFIVALGTQFLPAAITDTLPASIASIVTSPMMTGMILLLALHGVVNHGIRPALARRGRLDDEAATASEAHPTLEGQSA